MKKFIIFLFAIAITLKAFNQNAIKFTGEYSVTENWIDMLSDPSQAQHGIRKYNIVVSMINDTLISILYFEQTYTTKAIVKADSIDIYSQIFDSDSCFSSSIHGIGKGRLNNDTLRYRYRWGSRAGVFDCTCNAVKLKTAISTHTSSSTIIKYSIHAIENCLILTNYSTESVNIKLVDLHGRVMLNNLVLLPTEQKEISLRNINTAFFLIQYKSGNNQGIIKILNEQWSTPH